VPLSDFLLHVYCPVDDLYRQLIRRPLRSRGPRRTTPTDPEVITVELVGEFLGVDHDQGVIEHFRRHHAAEFPGPRAVHRTTFARQAANPYAVRRAMHTHLAGRLAAGEPAWLVASLPVEAGLRLPLRVRHAGGRWVAGEPGRPIAGYWRPGGYRDGRERESPAAGSGPAAQLICRGPSGESAAGRGAPGRAGGWGGGG
jgi:hypothetical protein